jgi:hypothetical protein
VSIGQTIESQRGERPWFWTSVVLLAFAPVITLLCLILWRTPFPISEAVAIFEDIANQPATRFLTPETSYYRPLFHMTISAIWHGAASLEAALAWIKLLHILPVVLLSLLLIVYLRPSTALDAAAALAAMAVLVGSPGFRDNLELPLSYTIVGMPLAVGIWMLITRERRWWHEPAVVFLALVAIGFKEQGLVLVPLVVAAWWTRAPGVRGVTAATLAAIAVAYVGLRLTWRESWPLYEQAVGLGFREMEPVEAAARYGAFPYLHMLYAYSGASTVANVLLGEPTRGTFTIVRSLIDGHAQPWQLVHLGSSLALSAVIAWWGVRSLQDTARSKTSRRDRPRDEVNDGWSSDARLFVALIVVLLASGALSVNYSRDRLGGMAVPFYVMAAYHALRAAAERVLAAPRLPFAIAATALCLLAAGWHIRAVGTLERARLTAARNHAEWLVLLPERWLEFRERRTYLRIMEAMNGQGTSPGGPRPTRYPGSLSRWIGAL